MVRALAWLLIAGVAAAQVVTIDITDTTLARGSTAQLRVAVALPMQRGDSAQLELTYKRSALRISSISTDRPEIGQVAIVRDTPLSGEDGALRIRFEAAQAVQEVPLTLTCTALWSGSSPTMLTCTALYLNGRPMTIAPRGGTLTLVPPEPLALDTALALGPLAPQPCVDELTVTYWLPDSAAPELALFDLLGREYARWQLPLQAAGEHTVRLAFDRLRTSSGVYHLRLRAGSLVRTAPCVIAK